MHILQLHRQLRGCGDVLLDKGVLSAMRAVLERRVGATSLLDLNRSTIVLKLPALAKSV